MLTVCFGEGVATVLSLKCSCFYLSLLQSVLKCHDLRRKPKKTRLPTSRFLLVILLIYISNVILLPSFTSAKPLSNTSPSASLREFSDPPTHSHHTVLAFPYAGASSLYGTKGLTSRWCQIRQSSATYAAGAMVLSMCLVGSLSLAVLGVVVGWWCSFYGVTNSFIFFSLSPNSSIGDPMLSSMVGYELPLLYRSESGRASGNSHTRFLPASTSRLQQ